MTHDNVTDIEKRLRYCSEHGIFKASNDLMAATYSEAADTIATLRKQLENAREALGKVFAHYEPMYFGADKVNAPGHGHAIAGIWDVDVSNGDKGGTECQWCKDWNDAREALKGQPC